MEIERIWTDEMEDTCDTWLKIHEPDMDEFHKDLILTKMKYDYENNIDIMDVIRENEEYKEKRKKVEQKLRESGIDPKQNLHEENLQRQIDEKMAMSDFDDSSSNSSLDDLEKSII